MNNAEVENEIQAKGLTAPRITLADVEANISGEFSFTVGNAARALNCPVSGAVDLLTICFSFTVGNAARALNCPVSGAVDLLTICVLTLRNGFTVTGESACASPENFDAEIGRKIARQNAINKVWPLMGYELRSKISAGKPESEETHL